jgi:heavy metal sensor kinase
MRFEQLSTLGRTLRFRLTLWHTAVVLVLLLVNLVAIRAGLQFMLSQMVDEFLDEELDAAVQDLHRLAGRPQEMHAQFERQATSHPRRQLYIRLLDERGALIWSSPQTPAPGLLAPGIPAQREPETVDGHRIVTRPVRLADGTTMTLRVGCSLEPARLQLDRFTEVLLGAAGVLLLIVPLGGYVLARRAMRPIGHIIETTARLEPTRLDERLRLRGTHDELDQLSQTINRFLDRIGAYLRQSREFTANAAHELRSPLTALQSSVEIALNSDRTTEEYKEVLSIILEECGQMRVLVNQLLLLAEGDAGRLRLQVAPLRLDQIAAGSLELFQAVAEAAHVELTFDHLEPVLLEGDGNRLWQVVNNLLDNAIKFTPAGGQVSVDLRLDTAGRSCAFRVADTGPGIAPHDLPYVFERFYQGDKARERDLPARGLGLGLSICQAVVAAHGGIIEVASTLGQGTTFTVRLPESRRPDSAKPVPTLVDAHLTHNRLDLPRTI